MNVEERLRRLELSNRRWRLAALGLGAILFACNGVTSNYERVRVRELFIVDATDRAVAKLVGKSTGLEFSVLGQDGKSRLVVDQRGSLNGP